MNGKKYEISIQKLRNTNSRLITFENDDNVFEESSEMVIFTKGINLQDVRYIDGIDLNRTYCNEVNQIYKYLGIEAARSSLIKELYQVYSDHSVNFHHISILVDVMTNTGTFTSMDRHGITDPDNPYNLKKKKVSAQPAVRSNRSSYWSLPMAPSPRKKEYHYYSSDPAPPPEPPARGIN